MITDLASEKSRDRSAWAKIVILAGGEGTRLRPLTLTRPKSMIPLGPRPVIEHLITHLAKNGFPEQIITVNYYKEQVMHHVGDGFAFGADVKYAVEPDRIFLGTAGSVKLAEHMLDGTFFVLQGDAFTTIDLRRTLDFHRKSKADVTVLLRRVTEPWLYGLASCDRSGRITDFQEKPARGQEISDLASTGIYCMETEVLDFIGPGECDFALDLFPRLLEEKKKLFGYVDNDYWVDVGSLQGYLEGMHEVLKMYAGKKRNPSMNAIIGIDTDIQPDAVVDAAALIEEGVTVGEHSRIGPDAVLKEGVSISGRSFVVSSALFEGVRVGSTCHIQESIVGEKAVIGDRVTVEGSIIGPGASIEDGVQVKNGSRIWPGVVVSRGTVVEGTLALPFDRPFFFCLDVGRITGVTANTIGDLMTVLKHVDIKSIEFHLHRRDFERWIREVFHANSLAEEISKLRKEELHGDVLRARLLNAVEEWFNRSIESEPRTQST